MLVVGHLQMRVRCRSIRLRKCSLDGAVFTNLDGADLLLDIGEDYLTIDGAGSITNQGTITIAGSVGNEGLEIETDFTQEANGTIDVQDDALLFLFGTNNSLDGQISIGLGGIVEIGGYGLDIADILPGLSLTGSGDLVTQSETLNSQGTINLTGSLDVHSQTANFTGGSVTASIFRVLATSTMTSSIPINC